MFYLLQRESHAFRSNEENEALPEKHTPITIEDAGSAWMGMAGGSVPGKTIAAGESQNATATAQAY